MRLRRTNEQNRQRNAQMRHDLETKRRLKKEIEDWLEEKVTTEFQLETGRARLRAVNDEMGTNQRAFDQEKASLMQMIQVKKDQLAKLSRQVEGIGAARTSLPRSEREIPIEILDAPIDELQVAQSAEAHSVQ